jgi:hypothetical protein
MKTIFALLVVASCALFAVSQAASRPFKLIISAEDPVVKAGSNIFIKVQMTNTSNHDEDCSMSDNSMLGMDVRYKYDVRDSTGNAASENVIKHPELATGHFRLCTLKPGDTATSGGNLITKLYKLNQPGDYLVQVSRDVSDNPKDGMVKSNTIKVTVTP